MSISLKSNADGTTGAIQINGTDIVTVTSNGIQQPSVAAVVSAATVDLSSYGNGTVVEITGTTATSAFTMNNGQSLMLVAAGAWPLTYNATTNKIAGGASYTCVAAEAVRVFKTGGVIYTYPALQGVAIGQTWQDVTASRALSASYTNNTGRPITVFVVVTSSGYSGSSGVVVTNDSRDFSQVGTQSIGPGNMGFSVSTVVLPGKTYNATQVSANLYKWLELR